MEDDNSSNFNKTNNTPNLRTSKSTGKTTSSSPTSTSNSSKKQPASNASAVPKAASRGRPPLPPSSQPRDHDRYMPMANVIRVMRQALPSNAKISDDAKDTVQECVSEFISFVTEEANERCQNEHRKTITADDLIWAMSRLGFDNYVEPLSYYLQKYREAEGVEPRRPLRMHQLPVVEPPVMAGGPHYPTTHNTGVGFGGSHGSTCTTAATATGTMVGYPLMVPSQTMAGGPHYPTTHSTGVGFGAGHGSTSTTTPTVAAATGTGTVVEHSATMWPQPMMGPNNPTTHGAGVGFGTNHTGSTSTGTANAAATPAYGFSPISNICFDAGSSSSILEFDDINLPPFDSATSDDSQGGGCFDPFDDNK